MSATIGTLTASVMVLACILSIVTSQSCDDVTCCPGKLCSQESNSNGLQNKTRCMPPTSCDQIDCPAGYACSIKSRGGVRCRATCSNVTCPASYTCKERHSSTKCVRTSSATCDGVRCPQGTTCYLLKERKREHAVCLGELCSEVNCSDGTQCLNGKRATSAKGRETITVDIDGQSATVSLKTLHTKPTKQPKKTPKQGTTDTEQDVAICLPVCEGNNVCPEGLVCHDDNHKITCRRPHSCEEVSCAADQECQEVECGLRKPVRKQKSKKKSKKHHKHVLVQCVDITTPSPTTQTIATTTETTTATTQPLTTTTQPTTGTTQPLTTTTQPTTATTQVTTTGTETTIATTEILEGGK